MSAQQPTSPIQYVIEWTIAPGGLDRFKELAREATRLVEQNEPDMVAYHWYLNSDQTRCTLLERYPNVAHMAVHRANLAAILPSMLEVASMELRAFGGLDDEAQAALAARGAEYREHFTGLSR